jgi:hypothetical protein
MISQEKKSEIQRQLLGELEVEMEPGSYIFQTKELQWQKIKTWQELPETMTFKSNLMIGMILKILFLLTFLSIGFWSVWKNETNWIPFFIISLLIINIIIAVLYKAWFVGRPQNNTLTLSKAGINYYEDNLLVVRYAWEKIITTHIKSSLTNDGETSNVCLVLGLLGQESGYIAELELNTFRLNYELFGHYIELYKQKHQHENSSF